jgi:hypothetical protein
MIKKLMTLSLLLGASYSSSYGQTLRQEFVSIGAPADVIDMDLPKPSAQGSVLIAMPGPLTPGIKVTSVTDNKGDTFKEVRGATSTAEGKSLQIFYCENCHPDVVELKFHMSAFAKLGSINTFLEVSGLALSSVLDGSGVQVSDGKATSDGLELGPSVTTTAKDFVIARYASASPLPKGVTPEAWTYKTTHIYLQKAPTGTYQPKLTGAAAGSNFAMSMAAFKASDTAATSANANGASEAGIGARYFPF